MNKQELTLRVMASMTSGDIYTDAPECAAAVASAQNLTVLARLLSPATTVIIAKGVLYANHKALCEVEVRADCSLVVNIPKGFDADVRSWKLVMPNGEEFGVAMFAGESRDDDAWVVDNAESFYVSLLADMSENQ